MSQAAMPSMVAVASTPKMIRRRQIALTDCVPVGVVSSVMVEVTFVATPMAVLASAEVVSIDMFGKAVPCLRVSAFSPTTGTNPWRKLANS